MTYLYYLYATTIFLSSFLLFQVQPLMGKHILPWFGGSSAVWITAMFFFMIALALGYLYAQLLSWFSRTLQLLIHTCMLLAVGGSLIANAALWPSAITPLVTDMVWLSDSPVGQVFLVLTLSVGLPFVLLSSSSSLLQYWYGRVSGREPFSLYAVSNVGSLLGLLSYPLVFERLLSTVTQGFWWSWGVGGVYRLCGHRDGALRVGDPKPQTGSFNRDQCCASAIPPGISHMDRFGECTRGDHASWDELHYRVRSGGAIPLDYSARAVLD